MKLFRNIAILLVFSLFITACATKESDEALGYSRQEIMFAEMMIPHHQQAIEMSDLALRTSQNPEILKLAEQIKRAQEPEIDFMKSWPGVDEEAHMGHAMMGMLDDEEMDSLRTATGKAFDSLFLRGMIEHHEGAIDMSGMILESSNPKVAELAISIINSQTEEIKFMKKLLADLK